MICPKCGFNNDTGGKFCGRCGLPLKKPSEVPAGDLRKCSVCGCDNNAEDTFCWHCGATLKGGAADETNVKETEKESVTPEKDKVETDADEKKPRSQTLLLVLLSAAILIFTIVMYVCFGPPSRSTDIPAEAPAVSAAPAVSDVPMTLPPVETAAPTPTPLGAETVYGWPAQYSRQIYPENAYASSELTWNGQLFAAKNAIDCDINTSWQEGVSGNGAGEYLQLVFPAEETFDLLCVRPGYGKSSQGFYNNNRVCDALLEFSDGSSVTVSFPDDYSWFTVELSKSVTSDYVRITILSTHDGVKYDDTVISDVAVFLN